MKRLFLLTFFIYNICLAQSPQEKMVKIVIQPDHENWLYKLGEKAVFNIRVMRFNVPIPNAVIKLRLGPERADTSRLSDSITGADGNIRLNGSMNIPGFLRCEVQAVVDGVRYKGLCTVGYEPDKIKAYTEKPVDFKAFWDEGLVALRKLPLDAKMTLLPDRCTEKTNVYHVSLQGYFKNSRIYGILCLPKKEGRYPALLKVPGAGVRPYGGDIANAERGVITFEIGIHGIPVNMDPAVYTSLAGGALSNYQNYNLDDPENFYYRRVFLNCIKANDFLVSLPQYDGKHLGVSGGSQGGALTIVTAALDKRVTCLAALFPALCDLTATLKGRAGGWPQYFEGRSKMFNDKPDKLRTCGYYDVVNFSGMLTIPGYFTWGFNDEVCPPSSTFAAFNNNTAPKTLKLYPDTGHWPYLEENESLNKWLLEQLGVNTSTNTIIDNIK